MNTQELSTEINETFSELLQLFSSFHKDQINRIPFEDSWTAGQLVEHLLLSGSGFVKLMNGPVVETQRPPDASADKIKTDLLDFSAKTKSADILMPADKQYDKSDLLKDLEAIRKKLNLAFETLNLTKTCVAFEFPVYGLLTRLEVGHFAMYHMQRHNHQLKNIYQQMTDK